MNKYVWAPGTRASVSANVAGRELRRIEQKHKKLTPEATVKESMPARAPLHKEFIWDDSVAAKMQREDRARDLIRHLRVIVVNERTKTESPERAYVNVVTSANGEERQRSYAEKATVLSNKELHERALMEALSAFIALRKRFEELAELRGVFTEIDKAAQLYLSEKSQVGVAAG